MNRKSLTRRRSGMLGIEAALRAVRDAAPTRNMVPFATPAISEDDIAAVTRVLRGGWLTTGEECLAFEKELAAYLGARDVVAVSSGTAALELALRCLDLPPGARVGVPTWTFVATATAILRVQATPFLLDVDPETLNLSPESLQAALATGLDAVVPVHFGGMPVVKDIHDLCAAAGVPVIEDAAHAFGAFDHRGAVRGSGSVAACFSFDATGNLTCGEGGAVVTDRPEIAERVAALRLHGLTRDVRARYRPGEGSRYDVSEPGSKANMPDLLAALGRTQLRRFEWSQARRRLVVARYRHLLAELPGVRIVPSVAESDSADRLFVVALPAAVDRDRIRAHLATEGVATAVHVPPLHHFDGLRAHVAVGPSGLDTADELAARVVSLPLHTYLDGEDVDRVVASLRSALAP